MNFFATTAAFDKLPFILNLGTYNCFLIIVTAHFFQTFLAAQFLQHLILIIQCVLSCTFSLTCHPSHLLHAAPHISSLLGFLPLMLPFATFPSSSAPFPPFCPSFHHQRPPGLPSQGAFAFRSPPRISSAYPQGCSASPPLPPQLCH